MSKIGKVVIVILCVWTFTHTYLLINNWDGAKYSIARNIHDDNHRNYDGRTVVWRCNEKFYPFTVVKYKIEEYDRSGKLIDTGKLAFKSYYFNNNFYDFTEFFAYVAGAWMLYFLYWFFKKK